MMKISLVRDFPGGTVVKTPHFHCEGMGSITGQEIKIPHAVWPKKWKQLKFFSHKSEMFAPGIWKKFHLDLWTKDILQRLAIK